MPENIISHPEWISIIRDNVLFAGIDVTILSNVITKLQQITVKQGDIIYQQDDEPKGLYLVISGKVQIFTKTNQKAHIISHALSNHLFGEFLLLGDSIRTTSAVALQDSQLFYLSLVDFHQLLNAFPQQFSIIANRVTHRLCWKEVVIALRLSPLFTDLSEDIVRALTKELKSESIQANTLLYQKGATATELCIVIEGRFQIIKTMADGQTIVRDVVGRGETIGEIGVLCETARTVDILATRDSTVAKLSRASFEKILLLFPIQINQAFSKSIVNRLSRDEKIKTHAAETFAMVVLSPSIATEDIAKYLFDALKSHGSTSILGSATVDQAFSKKGAAQTDFMHLENDALLHWLSEWEIAHNNVIYIVDAELSNWTRRSLREADHIIFIVDASTDPVISQFEAQILNEIKATSKKQTLVIMHDTLQQVPFGTSQWLSSRNLGMHHHVRYGSQADFGRVARFLMGKAVGLVLGGGGARGFAHIGVLRALQQLNIPIDLIGGNSMGALIAAQSAMQWQYKDIIERTMQLCLAGDQFTLPIISLFSGKKMARGLYDMFGDIHIDDLWHHYYSISCNISRATLMTHDKGSLHSAVLNSNTPPGLFPPQVSNGDLLVDGALLNNVPVDIMRKYNEGGTVIAVDVNAREDLLNNTENTGGINGWKILINKLNPLAPKIKIPNMIEILSRASIIGGLAQRKKMMDGYADLYLQPPVNNFSLRDYKHGEQIAEIGYQYALEEFQSWLKTQS
ncbi:MAG: cyclic nucleotide-binding and patatin-like phospholipase domain-containing protein [Sulfuricurvum sp.]|nr:cyclic nucleotide-binding and patatin-like phospholipase domain-containing protein [Sulfuricurvum sp.]